MEELVYEGGPEIYRITLNRPKARNALSLESLTALGARDRQDT